MAHIRIRFTKLGKIRWTSHRDVARMWERAFRRAELSLNYSSGFSPRPRVSFGLALPTGHESVAEYLDIDVLDEDLDIRDLPARLSAALPLGVDATAAEQIDPHTPSLQEAVTSSTWRWVAAPTDDADAVDDTELAARAASILAAREVVVTRNRKGAAVTDDIRDGIIELRVLGPVGPDPRDGIWLEAELASQPRSLRPSELLAAFGPDFEERHVRRLHQWISRHGARWEPLTAPEDLGAPAPASGGAGQPADATEAPHALERAS